MDIWKIIYITESGYEGEVEVSAVNKFMAWDIFEDIAKDFDEKVVSADCFWWRRIKMNETVKIWLENFINEEMDDVLGTIKNSKIWLLRSNNKEDFQEQLNNLSLYNEYLIALKKLKNRIEMEDL